MNCCDQPHCKVCGIHLYAPITGANYNYSDGKLLGPFCNKHKKGITDENTKAI